MNNEKMTLSKFDQEKIIAAIHAMQYSIVDKIELAQNIYSTAFSLSFAMESDVCCVFDKIFSHADAESETAKKLSDEANAEQSVRVVDMVVPRLFGGKGVSGFSDDSLGGAGKAFLERSDFIIGDLLLVQKSAKDKNDTAVYIYDGECFVELVMYDLKRKSVDSVLSSLLLSHRYAVLRPSYSLSALDSSKSEEELALTPAQEAVIETAKSYLLRGYRMQYDDTTFGPHGYRWQTGKRAPEDYTKQYWGYSNCAAFAIDVHRYSTGYETEDFSTRHLKERNSSKVFMYTPTGKETEADKAAVQSLFMSSLKPADIINVRYNKKDSGHAMLYIGNGNIIHSSGRNYNYDETFPAETYENTVIYMRVSNLFKEGDRRYLFEHLKNISIVRPLDEFNGELPENTVNRLKNLRGVLAEKLSSCVKYNTVDRGDEITFMFSVFNSNDKEITLDITDKVPAFTTYTGGAHSVDGDNLYFRVSVGAHKTECVSYTVKVNDDAPYGEYVRANEAKVGGVSHTCPDVCIRKTLTMQQREEVSRASKQALASSSTDLACVNEIYENAFSVKDVIKVSTIDEIAEQLFDIADEKGRYAIKSEGGMTDMLVPTFYSGRNVMSSKFGDDCARFVREEYLLAGDVIISVKSNSKKVYIRTLDTIINLTDKCVVENTRDFTAHLLATKQYFAVLRPSMTM
jgi:hypothetical protein